MLSVVLPFLIKFESPFKVDPICMCVYIYDIIILKFKRKLFVIFIRIAFYRPKALYRRVEVIIGGFLSDPDRIETDPVFIGIVKIRFSGNPDRI